MNGEGIAYVEWEDADTAVEAMPLASAVMSAALRQQLPDPSLSAQIEAFIAQRAPLAMDPNARLLLNTAREARRCALNLSQPPFEAAEASAHVRHGLVQIGVGAGQRRFLGSLEASAAQAIGPFLRSRRHLAESLASVGVPMPRSAGLASVVSNGAQATRVANTIGYPVVLRSPSSTPYSDARVASRVLGPLHTDADVKLAFDTVFGARQKAWVERYVAGPVWRVLVVDGQPASIFRLRAPTLIADGLHSVSQLLDQTAERALTERGFLAWTALGRSDLLGLHLRWQGSSLEHTPAAGEAIELGHPRASFAEGATDEAPDGTLRASLADFASRAAIATRVPLVAVDIVQSAGSSDTEAPALTVAAVTPEPDITTRHAGGPPNDTDIARRLIGLSPPRQLLDTAPIVAVTGSSGKTTTATLISAIFRQAGLGTGRATSIGCYHGEHLLEEGDLAGLSGSYRLLAMPDLQAFALESARGGMITVGRGFDWCDVGICLNVTEDHLGENGIQNIDDIAAVKSDVPRYARTAAVLNAYDPYCMAMAASLAPGARVILFSRSGITAEMQAHRASGGEAVFAAPGPDAQDWIVLSTAGSECLVAPVRDLPILHDGGAAFNLDNVLATVAACATVGVPIPAIAEALRRFKPDYATLPGRLNEIHELPFRLLLDSAKNRQSYEALARFAQGQPVTGRRLITFGIWPDTPPRLVEDMTRALAGVFDHFLLKPYRPKYKRAAYPKFYDLIETTLLASGIPQSSIESHDESRDAIWRIVSLAQPGDLAVVVSPPTNFHAEQYWENMQEVADEARLRLSLAGACAPCSPQAGP